MMDGMSGGQLLILFKQSLCSINGQLKVVNYQEEPPPVVG